MGRVGASRVPIDREGVVRVGAVVVPGLDPRHLLDHLRLGERLDE